MATTYGQRSLALMHLERIVDEAYEKAEDNGECILNDIRVDISASFLALVVGVLKSQEVREPLNDIVFFTGKPTKDTVCYHVLVNDQDYAAMMQDKNIHFIRQAKYTGVMERDWESAIEPIYKDNKQYCGDCGKRLLMRRKPRYCPKCGRKIKRGEDDA